MLYTSLIYLSTVILLTYWVMAKFVFNMKRPFGAIAKNLGIIALCMVSFYVSNKCIPDRFQYILEYVQIPIVIIPYMFFLRRKSKNKEPFYKFILHIACSSILYVVLIFIRRNYV